MNDGNLADALEVTPHVRHLADVIARWAFQGHDGPLLAAIRIASDPVFCEAVEARDELAGIRATVGAVHRPRPYAGDGGWICTRCRTAYPCETTIAVSGPGWTP